MAWPAGTAAGDLAILWDVDGPRPAGWASITGETSAYSKRLSSADIASALPVNGPVSALATFSAAGGVGRVRESEWCRIQANGVGMWVAWKTPWSSSALADATYQRGSTVIDPSDGYRHAVYARAVTSTDYYSPGGVHDRTNMVSIEILPLAAPLAPVWVAPASGSAVDRAAATSVTVAHQSAANAPQDKIKVIIRVAAGTWGSIKADGTIAAGDTSQELSQSSGTVQIAAGQLTANTTYELAAYTHDDGGWSPVSASLTLVARTVPTVAVTLTTAAGDLSPAVSWVTTPGVGSQTSFEVRISPAGAGPDAPVALWQSGLQAGTDTSWQAPASTEPTNGGSYVAWVRVTDSALRSAWTASTAQTVSWTAPDAPSGVVATNGTPPSVTVFGVSALAVALEWQWLIAATWTALTTTEGPAATETIRVPQAPYMAGRTYRVRSYAVVDGVRLASAWVTSSEMTSTDRGAYILSEDGREWVSVLLIDAGVPVPIQGVSESGGLGATYQRVDRTPVAGHRSWWLACTETPTASDTLMGWLTSTARPRLLLRSSPERRMTDGGLDEVAPTLAAVTKVDPDRVARTNTAGRTIRFDWTTQGA